MMIDFFFVFCSLSHGFASQPTGLSTIVVFCLMNMLPHLLYGPGDDALALTVEYGARFDETNATKIYEIEKRKALCNVDGNYFQPKLKIESEFRQPPADRSNQIDAIVIEMAAINVYV